MVQAMFTLLLAGRLRRLATRGRMYELSRYRYTRWRPHPTAGLDGRLGADRTSTAPSPMRPGDCRHQGLRNYGSRHQSARLIGAALNPIARMTAMKVRQACLVGEINLCGQRQAHWPDWHVRARTSIALGVRELNVCMLRVKVVLCRRLWRREVLCTRAARAGLLGLVGAPVSVSARVLVRVPCREGHPHRAWIPGQWTLDDESGGAHSSHPLPPLGGRPVGFELKTAQGVQGEYCRLPASTRVRSPPRSCDSRDAIRCRKQSAPQAGVARKLQRERNQTCTNI